MTLAQALDFLRYRMNEQGSSSPYYQDQEIYQIISSRAQVACSVLGLIEATDTSTSTVIGTQAYAWPSSAVTIVNVLYDGVKLQEMTFREWEEEKASGTTPSGTPIGYVLFNREILLIPKPSAVAVLTVYYEGVHPWITVSTATIDLPPELHSALMEGCLADMYAKALNTTMATFYENKWTGHMQVTFPNFKLRSSQRSRAKVLIDSDTAPLTDHGVR